MAGEATTGTRTTARLRALLRRDVALVVALHLFLTCLALWPIVSAPSRVSTPSEDAFGNIWAVTWVARHLTSPSALFAANMYWPQPHALTFTEGLFAQAAQAAPLLTLGASPLLAYNVVLFLTFPLSGLGMYLLARRLSGSSLAALIASLAYAFGPYRYQHLVHLQTLSMQWLPFVLLGLLAALERPRPRHLLGLGLCLALQALSSGYYAALLVPACGVTLLFRLRAPGLKRVLATLAVTGLLVLPLFLPYLATQRAQGVQRTRDDCVRWSAEWRSYLRPGIFSASPLRRGLVAAVGWRGDALYPGLVVLVAGLAACRLWRREPAVPLCLTLAGVGLVLSLGPEIQLGHWTVPGPYELVRTLPGFASLRTPVRMFPLALLGLAAAAALTLASLERRRHGRWALAALVCLAAWENLPRGQQRQLGPLPPPPACATWLASVPRGPVLELPWRAVFGAQYLYWSTTHGQPLVNGWGAYAPPENAALARLGRHWPAAETAERLRAFGVRYVVQHLRQEPVGPASLPPGASLVYSDAECRVAELVPALN